KRCFAPSKRRLVTLKGYFAWSKRWLVTSKRCFASLKRWLTTSKACFTRRCGCESLLPRLASWFLGRSTIVRDASEEGARSFADDVPLAVDRDDVRRALEGDDLEVARAEPR